MKVAMRKPGIIIAAIVLVETFLFLNFLFPTIRFSARWADDLTVMAFFLAPTIIVLVGVSCRPRFLEGIAVVTYGSVAVIALLAGIIWIQLDGLFMFGNDMECPAYPAFPHSSIHAFTLPGWGPVPEGFVIRQEMTIVPGVLLVKDVERGELRDTATLCDDVKAAIAKRNDLKPYVYF